MTATNRKQWKRRAQQHTQENNPHPKSHARGQASELEEVSTIVDKINPTQNLSAVNTTANLSPAQVHTTEAVPIGTSRLKLHLKPIRLLDHSQRSHDINLLTRQPAQRDLSLVPPALADQPPRALRDEEKSRDDDGDPDPLQRERQAIRPVVIHSLRPRRDAVGNELAHDEAQVDVASEMPPQRDGAHLAGVRGRDNDIATQYQTPKELTDQQDRQGAREELDEDQRASQHNAGGKGPFPPEEVHRVRGEEGAHDLAHGVAHGQARLPGGRDDIAVLEGVSEVSLELGRGVEVAEELGVEGEHNYA